MLSNPIAENVFGTLGGWSSSSDGALADAPPLITGTICWTVQLVPQIWKSWREKSTEGLSPWLVCVHRRQSFGPV
jgi:hypothetical protein